MLVNLGKNPLAKEISAFGVYDCHPIDFACKGHPKEKNGCFPEHRQLYLVYMFEWIWNDVKRIGINETQLRERPYTVKEIEYAIEQTSMDFALTEVDPRGKQALLVVRQGEINPPKIQAALQYLAKRYIFRDQLEDFLLALTRVELIPF